MSPEVLELTNRAVRCSGWRWVRGMTVVNPVGLFRGVVIDVNNTGVLVYAPKESSGCRLLQPDELPDLTDPATIGCLASLTGDDIRELDLVETLVDVLDYNDSAIRTDTVVS